MATILIGMRLLMGKVRYFLSNWGMLVQAWINPCGCHPNDVMVTHSNENYGEGKSYSYSFANHQQRTAWFKRHFKHYKELV